MPTRMCVCCRRKGEKSSFFRMAQRDKKYVFDKEMKIQARGFYVCKMKECIERLSKNKKYDIEIQCLIKMLENIKKNDIIDILKPMKNSDFFVFGIEENIYYIKKEKVKLVVIPRDINKKYIEEFLHLQKKYSINIIFIEKKEKFIKLFMRDVNVIGIFDKKVIKGILKKI
ncbi:MAG: DUF448 domain-containing protein [Leptotrichia sp.]|uniref:DUF448 domain-containing protein n=1 Tax=Leptotrichia sp. oral taxon 498 TaxID=712368 RepID=UPI000B8D1342|nr:DUF448 domain-containing protein [Leptotrichia sp. oral taxon 498]ASQ48959.1 ABC transporter [Leptotrichia sp. oral taxon 498]RKW34553.1 MAG: DUF448 domain-containing protein [Leptotrichia sp.]